MENKMILDDEEELFIENDEEGNIFELINEECYYDDKWEEENGGE